MDFEDIILSEITQKEKDKYCMISHVESKKKTKQTKKTLMEREMRSVFVRNGREVE